MSENKKIKISQKTLDTAAGNNNLELFKILLQFKNVTPGTIALQSAIRNENLEMIRLCTCLLYSRISTYYSCTWIFRICKNMFKSRFKSNTRFSRHCSYKWICRNRQDILIKRT